MPKSSKKAPSTKTTGFLKTPEKDDCSEQLSTYSETPVSSESRRRSFVVSRDSKQKSSASENGKDSSSGSAELISKIYQRNELALNKVRVSLFHNMKKSNETRGKDLAVDAKSFYGPSSKETVLPLAPDVLGTTTKKLVKNKTNLSSYDFPNKKVARKHRNGEINSGVGHGIKKLRRTVDSMKNETSETDDHIVVQEQCETMQKENIGDAENLPNSIENYNPNKKFFKYRRPDRVEISVGSKSKQKKNTKQESTVTCSNIFSGFKSKKKFYEPLNAMHSTPPNSTVQITCKYDPAIFKKESFGQQCQDRQDVGKLVSEVRDLIDTHLRNSEEPSNIETETGNKVDKLIDEQLPYLNLYMDMENNNFSNNEMMADLAIHNTKELCYQLSSRNTVFLMKSLMSDINLKKNSSKENSSENGSWACTDNPIKYQIQFESSDIRNVQYCECSFVCDHGNKTEVLTHFNCHSGSCNLPVQGWKKNAEIDIDNGNEIKIIIIKPLDAECYRQEAFDLLKVINKELGLCDNELIDNHTKYFFIYVKKNKTIGVLVAEYLECASRLELDFAAPTRMFSENIPVKCGVNVIWVSENHRRQGIATSMMDFLRKHFFDNYHVTLDDLAISIPTPDGRLFAEKYMGTCDLKVF